MRTFGNALLLFAALALIASPFVYHWRSRGWWRATPMGWHLMTFMGVLCEVSIFAVANFVWDLPSWVRPVVWASIGVAGWWRLILVGTAERPTTKYRRGSRAPIRPA